MNSSNNLIINSSPPLIGEIKIPGDKSISHRAVLIASLANGRSKIDNFLFSDDCICTIKAVEDLGIKVDLSEQSLYINGKGLRGLSCSDSTFNAGNSGTLMRLLTGVLAAQNFSSSISGDESLSQRPMSRIINPLCEIGAQIESKSGKAPLKIIQPQNLTPINYVQEIASAQVKSCLIFTSLFIDGTSTFIESIPTRDHTENLLEHFKYPIERNNGKSTIHGQYSFNAKDITIPSDISSAAFFIVGALINKESHITLRNININPLRTGIIEVLKKMGASINIFNIKTLSNELVADIEVKYSKLKSISLNGEIISSLIDELPILFIACALSSGISTIKGIEELRYKESDRILSMQNGLEKIGINVTSTNDSITIEGGKISGAEIDSFNDHRVAMAFAVCGLVSNESITIKNTKNIATSFPQFVDTLRDMGAQIFEI